MIPGSIGEACMSIGVLSITVSGKLTMGAEIAGALWRLLDPQQSLIGATIGEAMTGAA